MRVFTGWKAACCFALPAAAFSAAHLPIAILRLEMPDLDSAGREEWAREIGKNLASDTAFLVYDVRTPHGAELDRVFTGDGQPDEALRRRLSGGEIQYGLTWQCRTEDAFHDDAYLACAFTSWDLRRGGIAAQDSAAFTADLLRRPDDLKTVLTEKLRALLLGDTAATVSASGSALALLRPARPARILRGEEIRRKGSVASIPLGGTLQTGDMPDPAAARIGSYDFILFPHSSYSYLLPGVLCLNRGELGVLRVPDSTGFAAQLKSVVDAERNRELWKTTLRLAALDSADQVWTSLGKLAALDSPDFAAGKAAAVLRLPGRNPLCKTLVKLAALDSGMLVIRTLAEIAGLDSSRLLWSGFGRPEGLDSNRDVLKKIAAMAVADSGSFWRPAALLSAEGEAMILTPSCVLRGRPTVLRIRHEGDWTRIELPQGELLALPVLSSEQPTVLKNATWAETRGFALQSGTLSSDQCEDIASAFSKSAPRDAKGGVSEFLAHPWSAPGRSIRTFPPAVQEYFRDALSEIGAAPDGLNAQPDWPALGNVPETGRHASGCYLCRPNRLGP